MDFLACLPKVDIYSDWESLSHIENNLFNPEELNHAHQFLPNFNIDPEVNYFNHLLNNNLKCDYYMEKTFNDMFHNRLRDQSIFSLFHLNIRSAPKNLDKLEQYLTNLTIQFDVIGLTETWLKDSNKDRYVLKDYSQENVVRSEKIGGGVSLCIKNHLQYKVRGDLTVISENIESLFIEIDKHSANRSKNIVVGVLYRPPNSDIDSFLQYFEGMLSTLDKENNFVYLTGDYNLNLLNARKHKGTSEFIENIFSYSYAPLINKPTRVKNNSATIIDNIICNDIHSNKILNGVLYTDISDHFPIFSINVTEGKVEKPKFIMKRQYNKNNIRKFKDKISCVDWDRMTINGKCQESFSQFHSKFMECHETCFPIVRVKIAYRNRKPWLTHGLKRSIKIKNKMYVASIKSQTLLSKNKYLDYKRTLQKLLRKAERNHYDELFKQNVGNIKKSWDLIREVIGKASKRKIHNEFKINGKSTSDTNVICNAFNDFFVNIGTKLCESLPHSNESFKSYMPVTNPYSIFIKPVDNHEIKNTICNLKDKSPGWDGIGTNIIKESFPNYLNALTTIINMSLTEGIFPKELKTAKVTPLYKNGDAELINNYRPISILPAFSKIFERVMHRRLLSLWKNINYFISTNLDSGKDMVLI